MKGYAIKKNIGKKNNNKQNTYLTKKGYTIIKSNYSTNYIEEIKKELTVIPAYDPSYSDEPPQIFKVFKENDKKLYLPRFYAYNKIGIPDKNELINSYTTIDVPFSSNLRDYQKEITNLYFNELKNDNKNGGLICAACGKGKTVMANYIISKLCVKTLVLVHTGPLLTQWKERIRQFLPTARIGEIRGPKYDVVDKDIVIGMIQTIYKKDDYPDYVFRDFGLLIADECHHLGARAFCKTLKKCNFRYTLGLSATPDRKDGMSKVFKWYLGDIIYESPEEKDSDVLVNIYKYKDLDEKYSKIIKNYKGRINLPPMIKNIVDHERRNRFILSLIPPLIKEKRTILILSERIDQVNWFMNEIITKNISTCGIYIGGTKESILKKSLNCRIIVGSYSMISEGFDCKSLDTLIMLTPKTDIKQIVGRILRKQASERTIKPLVIDISDEFSTFPQKTSKRIKYYSVREYDITYFTVDANSSGVKISKDVSKDKKRNNNKTKCETKNKDQWKKKPKRKRTFKFNNN